VLVENFWNGHPGSAFNFGIGIDERNSQSGSEPPTDRRLAGSHHTDEHDRAVAERSHNRFRAIFRRFLDGTVNHAIVPGRIHGSIYQQSRQPRGQSCQRFGNVVVTRLK
jgi:hypothetical protein